MNDRLRRTARRHLGVALLFLGAVAGMAGETPDESTVVSQHPFLVSGALTHAHAVSLPEGVIVRSGDISIGEAELRQAIGDAPYFAREGLERDPIPVLEQHLAERLLAALAREAAQGQGEAMPADERELLRRYVDQTVGDVKPSEAELRAFYDENQEACGRLPFEQVKDYVARIVTERLQRDRVDGLVRDLGLKRRIEVSSSWLKGHAATALDNPVDRLRGKGKPVLAVFNAASCCGPDKMKPVLEEVQRAVGEKAHFVYVEARSNQALGIRHRVSGIPTTIAFDAKGREVVRHQGLVDKAAILGWLGLDDLPTQEHP